MTSDYVEVALKFHTTRDAISTCAQKPTRVSLIYRTEPTTNKWKTEKLKRCDIAWNDAATNA